MCVCVCIYLTINLCFLPTKSNGRKVWSAWISRKGERRMRSVRVNYIYIYVYMCVCLYVCVYIYIYIYIHA